VEIELYAVSADGSPQAVGFVGVVLTWDPATLALTGHSGAGAFAWASSGFPSDPAGLNDTHADGDAYFQAIVAEGGGLAEATAAGTLVTTLQFGALSAAEGTTSVSPVACISGTCTLVLDRHPFSAGAADVTGSPGVPVGVTVLCTNDGDCDDGNPCTDDVCDVGSQCSQIPNDANNPSDGQYCNGLEVCSGGQVVVDPGSIPNCNDNRACTADTCNEIANLCEHELLEGYCLIGTQCFVEGTLNPTNGCETCTPLASTDQWSDRPAGEPCGSAIDTTCDGADTCDGGGTCLENYAPAGTACGNASDTVCTDPDSCDGAGTCQPNHAPDQTPCDDAAYCTTTDACVTGICVGTGSPCPDEVCDEAMDTCKAVGLELRPALQGPLVMGETAELGLYVLAETGTDQPIAAINAILTWDTSQVELVDHVDNGPYAWMFSAFPDDSDLDGLNNTFLDGDALYQALVMPAPSAPAVATTAGLLVTTLRFQTVGPGTGLVQLVSTAGESTVTEVIDAETVGLSITGSLGAPAGIEIIECQIDDQCDDGEFCNGVETCAGTVCAPGIPPVCDDGLFCNGVETCQFGAGCVSAGNPCPDPTSCMEGNDSCGGCFAPSVEAEGCRYLAVTPAPGADPVAFLVEPATSDPALSCVSLYVQADGSLAETPVFRTPAEWDVVHVTGAQIVPSTPYTVHADCRPTGAGYLSAPVSDTTWVWGDVNHDGHVQINDVTLVHNGAQGIFEGTTVENLDVAGCAPNREIDAEDVAFVQAAYTGGAYGCALPCAACVSIDPPQPEAAAMPKNRFLSFRGSHPGQLVAIRVTFADLPVPLDWLNDQTMWVGEPAAVCENAGEDAPPPGGCGIAPGLPSRTFWSAELQCEPYYRDWSALGTVHVYGAGIVPGATYGLQVIDEVCDTANEASYSAVLPVSTSRWCDIVSDCTTRPCGPPNGIVGISTDAIAVVDKFKNLAYASVKTRCDLEPNVPDLLINITDVAYVIDAFIGQDYPFGGPPPEDLCP
jgi:hypothetical protein